MASRQLAVLLGRVISPIVSRSVGDRHRPDGGGREVAVVVEMSGEGGGLIDGKWYGVSVHPIPDFDIYIYIYMFIF